MPSGSRRYVTLLGRSVTYGMRGEPILRDSKYRAVPVTNRLSRGALSSLAESRRHQALVERNEALERRAYRGAGRYLGGQTLEEALASLVRLHAEGFDTGSSTSGRREPTQPPSRRRRASTSG